MRNYLSFNKYLQNLFNCKVFKVSIDAGFTCPNRDGIKGFGGCIYCDEFGSSSRINISTSSIRNQILKNIQVRKTRYKAKKFIAYFQSYTNTYANLNLLKNLYDEAVFSHPDIVGLSISTRSDCIDEDKVKLIASYKKFLPFISIELGLQTIHEKTLKLINRKEKLEDFIKAYHLIKKYNLHLCTHIILGLPKETKKDMLQTAKYLSSLKIDGVKLHLLIALKNTVLAKMYEEGKWYPLNYNEYIQIVSYFIDILPSNCIIHRTTGGGYPKDIITPKWIYSKKSQIISSIQNELKKLNSY